MMVTMKINAFVFLFSSMALFSSAQSDLYIDNEDSVFADILGGTQASLGEYPAFGIPGPSFACGSALIWSDILVSTASCRTAFTGNVVYLGGIQRNGNDATETIAASGEFLNPNYEAGSEANDIMLVKLESASQTTPFVWNDSFSIPTEASTVVAIGLGTTEVDPSSPYADQLMKVDLEVVASPNCAGRSTTQVVCSAAPSSNLDAGTCVGDAGSPLLTSGGILVGLNSFSIRDSNGFCDPSAPTGYTRMSTHAAWVRSTICSISSSPPCNCPGVDCSGPTPTTLAPVVVAPTAAPIATPVAAPTSPSGSSAFTDILILILNFLLNLLGIEPL